MSLTKRILSCMLLLLLLALVLLNAWHGEQEKRQEKTDFSAVFCKKEEIRETLADAGLVEEPENKKIAITFDDDVIIGLSQEISYKEAVSMI